MLAVVTSNHYATDGDGDSTILEMRASLCRYILRGARASAVLARLGLSRPMNNRKESLRRRTPLNAHIRFQYYLERAVFHYSDPDLHSIGSKVHSIARVMSQNIPHYWHGWCIDQVELLQGWSNPLAFILSFVSFSHLEPLSTLQFCLDVITNITNGVFSSHIHRPYDISHW
ncbi:hypothetical protein GYMLUDRAFT_971555 [Collybiopsis luxurians FD-317 M1]|uniref:Uncharacterized protein n=1 Tax=Collybiopsis luxurians FD-317 M1 TaxID=944289 RepID=A0A0D0APJ2_9AGAR|nr:hypothetical protein GYMLUDRAFT_971555 [Collybiopsis luxurians FD-317 M1]